MTKTLPKALRTQALTASTSKFGLVWFSKLGWLSLVWFSMFALQVWFGRFGFDRFGLVGLV